MERNTTIVFPFFVAVILVTASSCSNAPVKEKLPEKKSGAGKHESSKPPATYQDTLFIDKSAAVFYHPDSLQLEKIREVTEEGVFDGSMHEFFNQMRNARLVLVKYWPGIKIIEAKNVRYLLFIKNNNETRWIDLDSKNDAYGLFLFDTKKDPELADMMNIETELPRYFHKNE
jgi:hypothetical protein